jgi:uncharacterized protein (DUF58 family)
MGRAPLEIAPLIDALRGVTWPVRRRVSRGGMAGTHRSRLSGASPEFTAYRPYRQGDDPRRLDWKLLARTDRAFLRMTNDRATLGTMLLVDASASMAFPEPLLDKWRLACKVAIGLASVAHAAGDPVGIGVADSRSARFALPRSRRGIVMQLAALLEQMTPAGSPSLAHTLAEAGRAHRLVIISDFLGADLAAVLLAARARAATGDDVHAIHIIASEELSPGEATILATDPENHALARALVKETRAQYLHDIGEWRERLARDWRDAGIAYHSVTTGADAARAVREIVLGAARVAGERT